MIYDCFLFNGEFDALRIRFEELRDVVDVFCVFEAEKTFQGERKPRLHSSLARFNDVVRETGARQKVDRYTLRFVNEGDPWAAERTCRDRMVSMVGATDADMVLVSDADEIVRASVLETAALNPGHVQAFALKNYYYLLDWLLPHDEMALPVVGRPSLLRDYGPTALRGDARKLDIVHPNAGWHFSMLGFTPKQILQKFESFAHSELRGTLTLPEAFECIRYGIDCVKTRNVELWPATVDDSYPQCVQENPLPHLTRQGWK